MVSDVASNVISVFQNAGIPTRLGDVTAAVQKKEQRYSSHVNSGAKAPLYH